MIKWDLFRQVNVAALHGCQTTTDDTSGNATLERSRLAHWLPYWLRCWLRSQAHDESNKKSAGVRKLYFSTRSLFEYSLKLCRPRLSRTILNLSLGTAFVKISAFWLSVGIYITAISWLATYSRIKWNLTSMCFVLLWNSGFFSNLTALWLSTP